MSHLNLERRLLQVHAKIVSSNDEEINSCSKKIFRKYRPDSRKRHDLNRIGTKGT
jgi:hypothetical protein